MGVHTTRRATDRRLAQRTVLTGMAAVALLGAGAGSALACDDDDHGHDHHKKSHEHSKSYEGDFNNACSAEAGDIDNDATGKGGLLGLGQGAGPVASGSNVGVLNCSNILNDFANDNDVAISILGGSSIVP